MTDPHIDIDDVDNPDLASNSNVAAADEAVGSGNNEFGTGPNFTEFAAGFFNFVERFRNQSGFGTGSGFDPLPFESRKHFRNSQREFLLGWRTVIDDAIRRMDERDTRDNLRHTSEPLSSYERGAATKIEVEEIED